MKNNSMPSWFKIVNLFFFSNTVAQIQTVICGVILADLIKSMLTTGIPKTFGFCIVISSFGEDNFNLEDMRFEMFLPYLTFRRARTLRSHFPQSSDRKFIEISYHSFLQRCRQHLLLFRFLSGLCSTSSGHLRRKYYKSGASSFNLPYFNQKLHVNKDSDITNILIYLSKKKKIATSR